MWVQRAVTLTGCSTRILLAESLIGVFFAKYLFNLACLRREGVPGQRESALSQLALICCSSMVFDNHVYYHFFSLFEKSQNASLARSLAAGLSRAEPL